MNIFDPIASWHFIVMAFCMVLWLTLTLKNLRTYDERYIPGTPKTHQRLYSSTWTIVLGMPLLLWIVAPILLRFFEVPESLVLGMALAACLITSAYTIAFFLAGIVFYRSDLSYINQYSTIALNLIAMIAFSVYTVYAIIHQDAILA